ncbi:adenylate kinase [Leptolyngbya sp. 'hensonii']|uniref:adenylate kinase n=1 Tax=Leptolyngbya sp. 'hensonii' TaxID=1922337 RepID=UPI00094FFEC5|nr:adenylate kinase [Leptolyngbya sp. 'hensonii']OLP16023.1 adenylate kinase [Leptolyngbya sp. 'hensonii']
MRLVILGGPGSGRGTQARQVCDYLGIVPISTGDVLRQAITDQTELGQQLQSCVEKGELVPDEIMIQFMRQRLAQPDVATGWLMDGYPRTAFQAEELDFLLDDLGQRLNWAIFLDVPDPVLLQRSTSQSRLDDTPEAVQRRIELFHSRTVPILEYYERRNRLLRINGDQSPEAVQQDIRQGL